MLLCTRHSHDLLRAVQRKGMGAYVSKSAEEASRKARLWLRGEASAADFDPYAVAVLEINKKMQEFFHITVNGSCALCILEHSAGSNVADEWIDNVTDSLVVLCQTNDIKRA